MIKLSIIVPFYNVEPYIERCIRSLYNQDMPQDEYEVICIDDCSPDGSRKIVEDLQKQYSSLKLLCHTENKKQGAARNTGIMAAKGEYIWFVDADDYVSTNVFRRLYTIAKESNVDVLSFEYNVSPNVQRYETDVISGSEYVFTCGKKWSVNCMVVWDCIIKRSFILDVGLYFRENFFYEDNDYAIKLYQQSNRVKHIMDICYICAPNLNSTNTQRKKIIHVFSYLRLINSLVEINKNSSDIWSKNIIIFIRYLSYYTLSILHEFNFPELNSYFKYSGKHIEYSRFIPLKIFLQLKYKWIFKLFNNIKHSL